MTYPGDGQSGWGGQAGQPHQGGWGQDGVGGSTPQPGQPQQHYPDHSFGAPQPGYGDQQPYPQPGYGDQQGYPQPAYGDQQGFPQQGFGSYGGLGVFSGGEEPPRRSTKGKVWLAVGAVALLLVGGGATAYVLTRPEDGKTTVAASSSQAAPSSSAASSPAPTSPSAQAATCAAVTSGWNCLPVTDLAYSYDVPKSWAPQKGSSPVTNLDARLTGLSMFGVYTCEGRSYNRGNAGGTLISNTDLAGVAKDVADKVARYFYSSAPELDVKLTDPKEVTVPNVGGGQPIPAVQVDATITAGGNACIASKGMVRVLAARGERATHVFMANGDLAGGPDSAPASPTEGDLQAMIDSVRPLAVGG